MNITGNLNLPITRELVTGELQRIKGLLLEVKHGRATDLSAEQIERLIGSMELGLNAVDRGAPRVLGYKG